MTPEALRVAEEEAREMDAVIMAYWREGLPLRFTLDGRLEAIPAVAEYTGGATAWPEPQFVVYSRGSRCVVPVRPPTCQTPSLPCVGDPPRTR